MKTPCPLFILALAFLEWALAAKPVWDYHCPYYFSRRTCRKPCLYDESSVSCKEGAETREMFLHYCGNGILEFKHSMKAEYFELRGVAFIDEIENPRNGFQRLKPTLPKMDVVMGRSFWSYHSEYAMETCDLGHALNGREDVGCTSKCQLRCLHGLPNWHDWPGLRCLPDSCFPGWIGPYCNQSACEHGKVEGLILGPPVCTSCDLGWSGYYCNVSVPLSYPLRNESNWLPPSFIYRYDSDKDALVFSTCPTGLLPCHPSVPSQVSQAPLVCSFFACLHGLVNFSSATFDCRSDSCLPSWTGPYCDTPVCPLQARQLSLESEEKSMFQAWQAKHTQYMQWYREKSDQVIRAAHTIVTKDSIQETAMDPNQDTVFQTYPLEYQKTPNIIKNILQLCSFSDMDKKMIECNQLAQGHYWNGSHCRCLQNWTGSTCHIQAEEREIERGQNLARFEAERQDIQRNISLYQAQQKDLEMTKKNLTLVLDALLSHQHEVAGNRSRSQEREKELEKKLLEEIHRTKWIADELEAYESKISNLQLQIERHHLWESNFTALELQPVSDRFSFYTALNMLIHSDLNERLETASSDLNMTALLLLTLLSNHHGSSWKENLVNLRNSSRQLVTRLAQLTDEKLNCSLSMLNMSTELELEKESHNRLVMEYTSIREQNVRWNECLLWLKEAQNRSERGLTESRLEYESWHVIVAKLTSLTREHSLLSLKNELPLVTEQFIKNTLHPNPHLSWALSTLTETWLNRSSTLEDRLSNAKHHQNKTIQALHFATRNENETWARIERLESLWMNWTSLLTLNLSVLHQYAEALSQIKELIVESSNLLIAANKAVKKGGENKGQKNSTSQQQKKQSFNHSKTDSSINEQEMDGSLSDPLTGSRSPKKQSSTRDSFSFSPPSLPPTNHTKSNKKNGNDNDNDNVKGKSDMDMSGIIVIIVVCIGAAVGLFFLVKYFKSSICGCFSKKKKSASAHEEGTDRVIHTRMNREITLADIGPSPAHQTREREREQGIIVVMPSSPISVSVPVHTTDPTPTPTPTPASTSTSL